MYYKEALCSPLPHASAARLQVLVCIIKRLSVHCCYMHQRRDLDFRCMLWKSSVLAVTACNNGETASFGINCKEALCSLLLHASAARLQVSVDSTKRLSAHCCCMHQWRDWDFQYMCICHRKALSSLSLHATMARQRVSVYIIKALWCSPLLHASKARLDFLYML